MPAPATKHTLSDYPQLSITAYRKQLQGSEAHSLTMSYQYKGKAYRYKIELLKTKCNYGGYRYWWACPSCSKRIGVLYCAGLYVCRHCIGANYQTQLEQPWQRPDARMKAIRKRLGWQHGKYQRKPKGMHRATHERLFMEYIDIEDSYMKRLRSVDKLIDTGVLKDTHQLRKLLKNNN
ncbi:hypothetical protein [Psychrobacter pacificensis]|uniref:hypothetical protein n=1 Tax=Psychrobacter pacificensis TaxID=112002 RepID=UPI001CBD3F6B|nr:hypothetical protein [Psychrobacter pacificensis]MBZ1391332.1 hypothetical protein [Psychrobacter pacificensis]|tara:strand:- start:150 stop:683 length:534 start_codon:yes stop_codon:yes gene_type:complete